MSNCSKSNEEIPALTRGEGEDFNLAGLSLLQRQRKILGSYPYRYCSRTNMSSVNHSGSRLNASSNL
ncbi:hypothetical protein TNCV_3831991 [Trichonephila clavipes]|nr:hypothetical protein TNCV_3831991 [Trichonephila clavipes]